MWGSRLTDRNVGLRASSVYEFGYYPAARAFAATATKVTNESNPIQLENQYPGARDWQLTRVRLDSGGFRSPWIEGYCSRQSVKAGETIDIYVSTNPARQFQVEFFRMI